MLEVSTVAESQPSPAQITALAYLPILQVEKLRFFDIE